MDERTSSERPEEYIYLFDRAVENFPSFSIHQSPVREPGIDTCRDTYQQQ